MSAERQIIWADETFRLDGPMPVAEPPRPADLPADAVWIPLTMIGDDFEGGYWQESDAAFAARTGGAA